MQPDESVARAEDAIVAPRAAHVATPMRHPAALAGTVVVGAAMGAAEIVPGFSGGTVALVCGIYDRLIANVRQGARMLSLLVRGRGHDALRAFVAIEWLFVGALLVGMATSIVMLASVLGTLITEQPIAMSAVFLGLVLGAAAVATTQLQVPRVWHGLLVVAVAAVTFVGLGVGAGTIEDPALWMLFAGVAVAVCAWILPGVSGAFLLLLMGLYPAALHAVEQRHLLALAVMVAGALVGLAAFATVLNWLLLRAHDIVLAAMIGLMVGSGRVLWPWPSTTGMGDPTLGPPQPRTVTLVVALTVGAFAAVWIVGLVGSWVGRLRVRDADR